MPVSASGSARSVWRRERSDRPSLASLITAARNRQVCGASRQATLAIEQQDHPFRCHDIVVWVEALDLLEEGLSATARYQALALSLGAPVEVAQPAVIVGAARFEQEDVDLVTRDAEQRVRLVGLGQGPVAGLAQGTQGIEGTDPDREIKIAALVPEFDTGPPEGLEARHFFP